MGGIRDWRDGRTGREWEYKERTHTHSDSLITCDGTHTKEP